MYKKCFKDLAHSKHLKPRTCIASVKTLFLTCLLQVVFQNFTSLMCFLNLCTIFMVACNSVHLSARESEREKDEGGGDGKGENWYKLSCK